MMVQDLPKSDRQNGWLEILPMLPHPKVLKGKVKADYAVIGAGYGGLATARRLAELNPDSQIVLVEADRIGNNAAGRCSGFIIDHAHNLRAKDFSEDAASAKAQISMNRAGIDWLRGIVSREGIDCDWRDDGKIHAASSDKGASMLDHFAGSLDAIDEDYQRLDHSQLKLRFGTDYYRSGLLAPHSATVQPAALVRGLAATLPANVQVFEASAITDVSFGSPHGLSSARGSVSAPVLVLAVNGFIERFGFAQKRLIPLITWGSMTRELKNSEIDRLGGDENYGIIPAHPAGTTVRRLPNKRILIRNQYTYSATSDSIKGRERVRKTHEKSFIARYPMLAGVELEYTWGGALSLSRNGSGICGQVADGVFATSAYQGVGMAKGTISGKYLAEHIMGESPEHIGLLTAGNGPSRNYPDPFNRWGVTANISWRRRQAGSEE